MFVTWAVYGKPDISMTLNVLAGLVGVTAGCAA
jgi:Amt family ammonium transporter